MLGQELRLFLDLAGESVDLVARGTMVRRGVARMVLVEAVGEAGMKVIVPVRVVAQDHAAGLVIDHHLLEAWDGGESLLDLFQHRRVALGRGDLHPDPAGHLVCDL